MTADTLPFVRYEAFGAVGDGVHDDIDAIIKAHEHANAQGLPVRSDPNAIYFIGPRDKTAIIATDTHWSTSRFTIDDRNAENHENPLFRVVSRQEKTDLSIKHLQQDQERLDMDLPFGCEAFVQVEDADTMRYRRQGLNENAGFSQRDSFILHPDGRIEGKIDWDYTKVTSATAIPIDREPLSLTGGIFTTLANNMYRESGYHYWNRNIAINRSRTEVVGLTHYVAQETSTGCPYGGFLAVKGCARITLQDCFVSGHRTYTGLGSAGKPVRMGTYDITAFDVVDFKLLGCRMNHYRDPNLWGVIETSFCKNVLVEDCVLSRMDTHMGISGTYTIRRSTLGYAGFNAIGRGQLLIEDSTSYGWNLVTFRGDFGSTWDGELRIANCTWIPQNGNPDDPYLLFTNNSGEHDFGYPCSMPHTITIDGLYIDDSNPAEGYTGPCIFCDSGQEETEGLPYPYALCRKLVIRGLSTASGKEPVVSKTRRIREALPVQT